MMRTPKVQVTETQQRHKGEVFVYRTKGLQKLLHIRAPVEMPADATEIECHPADAELIRAFLEREGR